MLSIVSIESGRLGRVGRDGWNGLFEESDVYSYIYEVNSRVGVILYL